MDVEYVFVDWKAMSARTEKNYPPTRVLSKTIRLMSVQETEQFIIDKLQSIKSCWDKTEAGLPSCSREDLWQKPDSFAYFKNPDKMKRATKIFYTQAEAMTRKIEDGSVGTIQIRKGKVKHCLYCAARPICGQAEQLTQLGLIE